MADETTPTMPPQVQAFQQELFENLRFMKRQQWAIANYMILLFVALYVFHNGFSAPTLVEKTILTVVVGLTAVIGTVLIVSILFDMHEVRRKLAVLQRTYLVPCQPNGLGLRGEEKPLRYDFKYIATLIAVPWIGAGLLCWSFWR